MGELNLSEPFIKCWIVSSKYSSVDCLNNTNPDLNFDSHLTFQWALSTSILPLGAMLGGLVGGTISNKIGRKTTTVYNAIFCVIISVLLGLTTVINRFWIFILNRYLIGINIGIGSAVSPIYINEIAPKKYSGAFGSCFQLGICFGLLFSYFLSLDFIFGTQKLWPVVLGLGAVLGVLQLILCWFTPESPTWLMSNGRHIDAILSNESLKGPESILDRSLKIEDQNLVQNLKEIYQTKPVRKATLVVMLSMMFQQFSGVNAIFFYSGSIFKNVGIPNSLSGVATVGLSIINVLFVFVAIISVDKIGRKILLYISYSVMAVMCVATSVLLYYSYLPIASYLSIVALCIFVAAFESGAGPIPYILAGESIPNTYKAGSQSLGVVVLWFSTFIIGILFPPMQNSLQEFCFIPLAVLCVIALLFNYFIVVESSGKSVAEILRFYASQKDLKSIFCK